MKNKSFNIDRFIIAAIVGAVGYFLVGGIVGAASPDKKNIALIIQIGVTVLLALATYGYLVAATPKE